MTRLRLALCLPLMLWLVALPTQAVAQAAAQDAQGAGEGPVVRLQLDPAQVVPGQYATLRVTVLVPTWMPAPVEFPSFEMPNLRVRLPDKSTTPTSARVAGATWSGVTRRYLLSPMVAGRFEIAAMDLGVSYAAPGGTDPLRVRLRTDPVTLEGVLPAGAEDLHPFIAARALTLTQELSQPLTGLTPGEGVVWSVTARIEGASPIVLPPLMPDPQIPGFRAYADQPRIDETDGADGALSGTRSERLTLMAEAGGGGALPGMTLRWFDLDSGRVETAQLPGFEIAATGPPAEAAAAGAGAGRDRDWRRIAIGLGAGLAVLLLLWRLLPPVAAWRSARRARWLASKAQAARALRRAVARRDHAAVLAALDIWKARAPRTPPAALAGLSARLAAVGAGRYGRPGPGPGPGPEREPEKGDETAAAWAALEAEVRRLTGAPGGGAAGGGAATAEALAPLNPGGGPV